MKRVAKTSIGIIGFVALVALAAPAPAWAGPGGRGHGHGAHKIHKHGHRHGQFRGHRGHRAPGPARFVVPRHIQHHQVAAYRPYRWQRTFFRPHRHHHVVYRFPVWTPYGVVHRPYAYCDGALVDGYAVGGVVARGDGGVGISVRTPRLSVSFYGD